MKARDLLARAPGEIRIQPSRQDGVDLNVVGQPRAGERTSQLHDPTLARGISRDDRCAEYRIHRSDIDDLATSGRFHMRIDGLRAKQRAAKIDVQNLAPVRLGKQFGTLPYRVAGVVDENVAGAKVRNDALHHRLARRRRRRLKRIEPAAKARSVELLD